MLEMVKMVAFAGLEGQVTVIEGAFSDNLKVLAGKAVDVSFVSLCDVIIRWSSDGSVLLIRSTLSTTTSHCTWPTLSGFSRAERCETARC